MRCADEVRGTGKRWGWRALAGLLALFAMPLATAAYPERPITIVVNSEVGGPTDLVARVIRDEMTRLLGQSVVIDNKLGAGGVTGAAYVAQAPADGYTLLLSGSGPMVLAPLLYKGTVSYNPLEAFRGVNMCVDVPVVLVSSAMVPAQSIKEFIALAKKNPGKYTYGTAGIGTPAHLMSEAFKKVANIDMLFIPYKGSPAALLALVRGELSVHVSTPAVAYPHAEAGKVRLLAVTGNQHLKKAPNVPTFAEAGLADVTAPAWFGLFAPKGVPTEIVDAVDAAAGKALALPKAHETLGNAEFVIRSLRAAETDRFLRAETDKWGKFISENNIKVQ